MMVVGVRGSAISDQVFRLTQSIAWIEIMKQPWTHTMQALYCSSRVHGSASFPAGAQAVQPSKSWSDILAVFDTLLATVKQNSVPRVLVQALKPPARACTSTHARMHEALFNFVNVQLFN